MRARISEVVRPLNMPMAAMKTSVLIDAPMDWSNRNLVMVFPIHKLPFALLAAAASFELGFLGSEMAVVGKLDSRNFWKA